MKIMVVDDEPIIADTLVDVLNGEGHNALSFSQSESASAWRTSCNRTCWSRTC